MSVTISIISNKKGEINDFFNKYFEADSDIDNNVVEWMYLYRKNNIDNAINTINTAMNNSDKNDISVWLRFADEDIMKITQENKERLIKKVSNIKKQ